MAQEVTYKFNILTIIVLILAIFACGYFARKEYVSNKEIRKLEKQVKEHENISSSLSNIVVLKSDTIIELKKIIKKTNQAIVTYKKSIKELEDEIASIGVIEIPVNRKYEILAERTEPDTLPKEYCFSDRQIGYLYNDNQELPIRRDEVNQYESLTDALNYNLELTSETYRLANEQLTTCQSMNEEATKALLIRENQVNLLKKQKKGRSLFTIISTAVAVVTTGLLIAK